MTKRRAKARTKKTTPRKHSSKRMVGVDFGAHSLKLAEVEHGPLGSVVRTFGVAPYSIDKAGRADLVATLERLARSAHISSSEVVLTLSETEVCMIATGTSADTILQKLNPRLASVAVCWPSDDRLIAIPRWVYDFYHQVIDTAGLKLIGLQHVSSALGRSVAGDGRVGVLDVGAESTSWFVFDHGELVQRASLPYGSEALTQALALAHGWTRDNGEEHKRRLAGDPRTWPEESTLVMATFLERWWQDLFRHLAEHPSHLNDLVLVGGGSRLAALREHVFEQLGLMPREWRMPTTTLVAEELRPHLEPQLPILANSLSHLVY
ncbi:MAG: pilus assembly protein PilM [bacterium]|nr:pilus assembly protein PilM [bacterium]